MSLALYLMGRDRLWCLVALCLGVEAMHTVVHCFLEAACITAGLEASILRFSPRRASLWGAAAGWAVGQRGRCSRQNL